MTRRSASAHEPMDSKSMKRIASASIAEGESLRNARGDTLSPPSPVLSGKLSHARQIAHGKSCENCSPLMSIWGSMYASSSCQRCAHVLAVCSTNAWSHGGTRVGSTALASKPWCST